MNLRLSKLSARLAALTGAAIWLSGCANNPVADEKIAVAKASLQRAEQAGAPQAAPLVHAAARDKLARAERANAEHNLKPATELAEQANVDAQLAEATAQQQRAHKAAGEFDASLEALRQESVRSSQPSH
jgi:tetratricopeptide (TPR) repeat protein